MCVAQARAAALTNLRHTVTMTTSLNNVSYGGFSLN